MRKLWVSIVTAFFVLLAGAGALVFAPLEQPSVAAQSVRFLKPWAVEVWRAGDEAILGGGVFGPGPDGSGKKIEAMLYRPGRQLLETRADEDTVALDGKPITVVWASDGSILGVKPDWEKDIQSAVAEDGKYALVSSGTEVALLKGHAAFELTAKEYRGHDLAEWAKGLSQVKLYSVPVVGGNQRYAVRVMVPDETGTPVVSIWAGDLTTGILAPMFIGTPNSGLNLIGFDSSDMLWAWDAAQGLVAIQSNGDIRHLANKDILAQSVSAGGWVFGYEMSEVSPRVISPEGLASEVNGFPVGWAYSYGGQWSPDGSRLAFLAHPQGEEPSLVIAERDGSGLRVTNIFESPDSEFSFAAEGELDWANNLEVIGVTHGRSDHSTVKSWAFSAGREGAK